MDSKFIKQNIERTESEMYVYNWFCIMNPLFPPVGWRTLNLGDKTNFTNFYRSFSSTHRLQNFHGQRSHTGPISARSANSQHYYMPVQMTNCTTYGRTFAWFSTYFETRDNIHCQDGRVKQNGLPVFFVKNDDIDPGSITDVDGNVYPTVKFGNTVFTSQIWRCTKFSDGTSIPFLINPNTWSATEAPAFAGLNYTKMRVGTLLMDVY